MGHWSQGAARLVNAFSGVRKERQASAAEEQGRSGAKSVIDALLGGGTPAPSVSMSSSGTLAPGQPAMIDAAPQQAALGAAPAAAVADEQAQAQAAADWLRYSNQGATRNKPLDPKLAGALSFLPELGVTMEVFSGGQDAAGSGGQRTGSTRHDHGQAADAFFYKDGRKLDWANPNDQPIFQEIVRRGKAAGVTGFGAGDGYMQPGSMHIGFGSEAVWGAGGKGENAPDWLRAAAGGPAGQVTASAQNAPSVGGYAPQGTSPVMQALLQASTDPWVAQEYGPVLQALMGQEQSRQQFAMEQADPMRQLQMQKAQLEIEQMRNPTAPKPIEVGGVLLDPVTYQPIFDSRQFNDEPPVTKTVKMQDGSEVMVQWNPSTQVWDASPIPEGGTGGAAPGKLTESQAKTTLFQNLQTETQPVLLDLEKQFDPANMTDKAAANLPIVGNYFTSPEYQLYKSNATAWAEGALRISTGAAATEPEIQRNLETYFAQPGDTPMTVAYKAQMREMYNRSIERSLGLDPGDETLPLPSEFAAQFAAEQPPPKMGGVLPTPPGLEPPTPAPEPQRQGATPFRTRGLSPAPPESAPIEDLSNLPVAATPAEAMNLPSGTKFRAPDPRNPGSFIIRMVP